MSTVQGEAAVYVLSGNHQVVMRGSRANVPETHQLIILLEGKEICVRFNDRPLNAALLIRTLTTTLT